MAFASAQEGSNTPQGAAMESSISHVGANLAGATISNPAPPAPQIGYNAPAPPPPQYQQPYPPQAAPPPGPSPFDDPPPASDWAVTRDDKIRYDVSFARADS